MGWLFGHSTKKELVEHLLKQHGEHVELIDHSLTGNKLWLLFNHKVEPFGRFIVLCLLQGMRSTGYDPCRWGYKDIDETMGPYETGCPERLLAQSTSQEPNAVAWRAKCREARAKKTSRAKWLKTLKPGDKVRWGGKEIITLDSSPFDPKNIWSRRGQVIGTNENGHTYSYRTSSIHPLEPACVSPNRSTPSPLSSM